MPVSWYWVSWAAYDFSSSSTHFSPVTHNYMYTPLIHYLSTPLIHYLYIPLILYLSIPLILYLYITQGNMFMSFISLPSILARPYTVYGSMSICLGNSK